MGEWTPVDNLVKVAPQLGRRGPDWQLEFRKLVAIGRFGIVLVRYRKAR